MRARRNHSLLLLKINEKRARGGHLAGYGRWPITLILKPSSIVRDHGGRQFARLHGLAGAGADDLLELPHVCRVGQQSVLRAPSFIL